MARQNISDSTGYLSGDMGYAVTKVNGNNTALASPATLTTLSIPALSYASHVRAMYKFRVNHTGAAGWTFSGSYLTCTPAAVAQGGNLAWTTLAYTYGAGGPLYFTHIGHDYYDLVANQAYTLSLVFQAQTASALTWDPEATYIEAQWMRRA